MLVLFKGEVKGPSPIPTKEFFEPAKRQTETLNSYQQQGKIVTGGVITGRKGSYAIFDVDSINELQNSVTQTPLFPFIDVELVPLISYEQAQESVRQMHAAR